MYLAHYLLSKYRARVLGWEREPGRTPVPNKARIPDEKPQIMSRFAFASLVACAAFAALASEVQACYVGSIDSQYNKEACDFSCKNQHPDNNNDDALWCCGDSSHDSECQCHTKVRCLRALRWALRQLDFLSLFLCQLRKRRAPLRSSNVHERIGAPKHSAGHAPLMREADGGSTTAHSLFCLLLLQRS